MKITLKLFLTLFGLITFVVLVSLALARWSFQQGFYEYISGLEQNRLQRISGQLKQEYVAAGNSWETLKSQEMNSLVNNLRRDSDSARNRTNQSERRPPPEVRHHRPPPHHSAPGTFSDEKGPPTALYDANDEFVLGDIPADVFGAGIQLTLYLEDETGEPTPIGELRSWPKAGLSAHSQSKFAEQQLVTSLLIALACLLLAGLVSWVAATRLLKPVRAILRGISELSNGRYSVSFPEKRQDELGQLMADVTSLSDTLEKNRSAKNRLFADISHELRTPLTVLAGEIEMLKAGIRPFDQLQLRSFEQEIQLLRHLVDDLYDLSLSDVGGLKYNFSPQSVLDVLAIVLDSMHKQAEEKQISLELKVDEGKFETNIDAKRIEQLLRNLCANSIAYTDAPGRILFTVNKDNNHIIITVDDTKPGVTEKECALLFDPLYRQDASRTRRESGAGLGLTIGKNVVEAHGGKIEASPSDLGGLKVEVSLPLLTGVHK
ncbi:ATP-binding protein [Planctobacterium marinum]|uniref:histidine kinase n=1 Tax=Planctobacterium marinum TaxID=1631968 RepID=A0AA48KSY8_9ALTE|nr:two-component sensor histidine kinase [Planctobacterium marinum]